LESLREAVESELIMVNREMEKGKKKGETYERGEKCDTTLLTEMEVGNAMPTANHENQLSREPNRDPLTFCDFHAFYILVVHCCCALLEELVAFEAEIEDLHAGDAGSCDRGGT
jgi:hypothetical protein